MPIETALLESQLPQLPDRDIQEGYRQAAERNVLQAVYNEVFYGYFAVCADGVGHGFGNSYPGLDGQQMCEALLWLGQTEIVHANWDYVRSFQRPNGQMPFAILPGFTEARGAPDSPAAPVEENGALFRHWVPGDPLRTLANTSYIQTADNIFRHTHDCDWLDRNLDSLNRAANFLGTLVDQFGCVAGAGFYLERPTRIEHDGVAQCYVADAFKRMAALNRTANNDSAAAGFDGIADRIADHFQSRFWLGERFAEYIHPERGPISHHGLSDTDWAAIATGLAAPRQQAILWPRLKSQECFNYGGMPTGIAAVPEAYQDWETTYPDWMDRAAMGRVWYLEAWARARMDDGDGLLDSLLRVVAEGERNGYYWRERYWPDGKGGCIPAGAEQYCEYPANLIRIVQGFLLGVRYELNGRVNLAPVAPAQFWRQGFGQTLSWNDRTLDYRLQREYLNGTYRGPFSQKVAIRLPEAADSCRLLRDGIECTLQRDVLELELPGGPGETSFEIAVSYR